VPTEVTFQSDGFNTSESRPYFINPECYGDDLAKWMMERLRATGYKTADEPGQEDFGWYFDFEVPAGPHCCVIGYQPDDPEGQWIVTRRSGSEGDRRYPHRRARDSERAVAKRVTPSPARRVRYGTGVASGFPFSIM